MFDSLCLPYICIQMFTILCWCTEHMLQTSLVQCHTLTSMSHFDLKSHMTVFHILHKLCLLHKFYGMQWECSKWSMKSLRFWTVPMYSIKPLEFKWDSIILLYFFFIIVNILMSCFSITIIDKLSLLFCDKNTSSF